MSYQSLPLLLDSDPLSGSSDLTSDFSSFTYQLSQPIDLRNKKNIRMALHSANVVYSFVNISPNYNNNIISFYNNYSVVYIELKKGIYGLNDINQAIYEKITSDILQTNTTTYPEFTGNPYDGTVDLYLPKASNVSELWHIDWDTSTIKSILGFTNIGISTASTSKDTYVESSNQAQLNRGISSGYLYCSICSGGYFGGKANSNIIYPIDVTDQSPNENISVQPSNLIWVGVNTNYIERVTLRMLRNDGTQMDLNGEYYNARILITWDE